MHPISHMIRAACLALAIPAVIVFILATGLASDAWELVAGLSRLPTLRQPGLGV